MFQTFIVHRLLIHYIELIQVQYSLFHNLLFFYCSIFFPASRQALNPLCKSKTLYPFLLSIFAAFLLRLPLRQYNATGLSF